MTDPASVLINQPSADPIENNMEFNKKVDRPFLVQQATVTQAAHELSKSTDLFYTPRVLGYSIPDQILRLERLPDLVPLRDLVADDRVTFWILSTVARSLAYIHTNLHIPAEHRLEVPKGWMMGDSHPVPLHGDFNLVNVTWQSESNRLIILDWASAPGLGFDATVGPRELDIAHFLRSLLLQQTSLGKAASVYSALRDAFLREYQLFSPVPIHHKRLNRMLCRLSRYVLFRQLRCGKVRSMVHSVIGQLRFERDRLRIPVRLSKEHT